jgi:hypothetical protein
MSSILKVDTIQDQSGNNIINENADTITIGASGDTISIPSGATLSSTDPLVFPAGTVSAPAITTTGDTNTGIFFSAADTIDFAEGGVATGQFDSSGNFKFNSGYGSVATAYACRAWVNFNGTGTPAIREDGNVTSITDNGTGDYTVNFTTAISDANYAAVCTAGTIAGTADSGRTLVTANANATGSCTVYGNQILIQEHLKIDNVIRSFVSI